MTTTYEMPIEKGIPLPRTGAGRPRKYRWREMDIGDSFFAPANGRSLDHLQSLLGSYFKYYEPRRFASRRESDGVRVWRIA